jgi:2,3-bisphosphoglycerate-dependent phosphoglycerate mutase
MRLILLRHGETDWNVQHRIQGSTNIPLNANGERQAQLAAERLASVKLDAIYASDYERATNTANNIAAQHAGVPVFTDPDLRERSWGLLEGLTWDDMRRDFPEEVRGTTSGDFDYAPPAGESKKFVFNRALRFVERIVRKHPDSTVLIVTHGGVASLLLKHALGIDLAARTPFRVENCGVNIIDTDGNGSWYIHTLNDMSHLGIDIP